MRSAFGEVSFAILMSLVNVVFLTFVSCCFIRYAETRLLGSGGKQGRGGGDMTEIPPLRWSGIQHITGLDGSILCMRIM